MGGKIAHNANVPEDPTLTTTATSRQTAVSCARLCDEKKASDIVILDVRKLTFIADYFVICSTSNERQSKAISDGVAAEMKSKGVKLLSNGHNGGDGRWVLQDIGDVVVHVFQADARTFYDLDGLWADAKLIGWQPAKKSKRPGGDHGGAAAN